MPDLTQVFQILTALGVLVALYLNVRKAPVEILGAKAVAVKTQAEADEIAARVRKEAVAHDEEISEDLRTVRKAQRSLEGQVDDQNDQIRRLKRVADEANDRADRAERVAVEANTRADRAERVAVESNARADVSDKLATSYLERIQVLETGQAGMRLEIDGFPDYIKRLEDKLIAAGIDISDMHAPPAATAPVSEAVGMTVVIPEGTPVVVTEATAALMKAETPSPSSSPQPSGVEAETTPK